VRNTFLHTGALMRVKTVVLKGAMVAWRRASARGQSEGAAHARSPIRCKIQNKMISGGGCVADD
jgi:hypothetical protein